MDSSITTISIKMESISIQIKTTTMATGGLARQAATVSLDTLKEFCAKESGIMICSMELARNIGLMEPSSRGISVEAPKNQANLSGLTRVPTKENSKIINLMEKELLFGRIKGFTKAYGKII